MSKGLGKLQRQCLAAIRADEDYEGTAMRIAAHVLDRNLLTAGECEAFRRALRSLSKRGLIEDVGRHWRDRRRRYRTPEAAAKDRRDEVALLKRLRGGA